MDPFTHNRLAITIYTETLQEAEAARRRSAWPPVNPTPSRRSPVLAAPTGWGRLLARLSHPRSATGAV